MLYDRWRNVVMDRAESLALCDLADGRRWSFRHLARAAESCHLPDDSPFAFPRGSSAEFILTVLAAWRDRRVVCPLEPGQPIPRFPPPPPGAVHLKTTSGSTAAPRGIWFAAEQLAADSDQIVATMQLRPQWPNLAAISLAHSYGFSNLVLPLLLKGIPLYLAPAPLPEVIRRAGSGLRDLTLPAVPVLWRAWLEASAIPPSTRLAISAGAPLPLDLEQQVFRASGVKLRNFYGASECGGIAFDRTDSPRPDARLAGTPLRGVRLDCDPDGCLIVNSPAAGSGYWPVADPRLSPGRFQTADLARLEENAVYLIGRAADLINVAGRKVSPEEVETAIREHPAVADCVVFGAPPRDGSRDARGDLILAWVVPRQQMNEGELRAFLAARLPPWKVPRRFLLRDRLPVNPRGKISRALLRDQFSRQGMPDGARDSGASSPDLGDPPPSSPIINRPQA
jgi:acyl-CoA synthetase (AMP-forming)/AMP-acid ligase II